MDPNNTHEVIFWDNLYKLRPWLYNVQDCFPPLKTDEEESIWKLCCQFAREKNYEKDPFCTWLEVQKKMQNKIAMIEWLQNCV